MIWITHLLFSIINLYVMGVYGNIFGLGTIYGMIWAAAIICLGIRSEDN